MDFINVGTVNISLYTHESLNAIMHYLSDQSSYASEVPEQNGKEGFKHHASASINIPINVLELD